MRCAFLVWIGLAASLIAQAADEEAETPRFFVDRVLINPDGIAAYAWKEGASELMVVRSKPNALGWKIASIEGDFATGENVVTKLEHTDGKIVDAHIKKAQLKPKGPPAEAGDRVRELSLEQRQELFERMRTIRDKDPSISREELRERFFEFLDQIDGEVKPES
ncbi:MAG: hypothetical protein AAF585_03285 [Verrucomicrobiota bacterium]